LKKYWEVKAKANKTGELLLYGNISSDSFWGDEITPKTIDAELKALGEINTLNVYVNSGGGSVFAGQAIFNIIKRHSASVKNAYVDGLAGSIASIIPMACDKVFMPSNAMMMIHNPSMVARGFSTDLRKAADMLDKVRDVLVGVYVEKSGQDEAKMASLMDAETWLSAKEAIALGLADELQAEVKIAASIDGNFLNFGDVKVDTSLFRNFKPDQIETYRAAEKAEPVSNKDNHTPSVTPEVIAKLHEEWEKTYVGRQAQNKEFYRIKNKILGGQ